MGVGFDVALRSLKAEDVENAGHHGIGLQRPIRINGEPRRGAVVNDAASWEVLVLMPGNRSGQVAPCQAARAEAAPCLPNLEVAASVGQEVAIAFALSQRRGVDRKPDKGGAFPDTPKDAEKGTVCAARTHRVNCGEVLRPAARSL